MSKRELKKLQESGCLSKRLRSGRARITPGMTSVQESENLEEKLESLMGQLQEKDQEVGRLRSVAGEATSKLVELRRESDERVSELERELTEAELQGEIAKLRALEELRKQHRLTMEKESERMDSWIKDLKKGHGTEKKASVGFGDRLYQFQGCILLSVIVVMTLYPVIVVMTLL